MKIWSVEWKTQFLQLCSLCFSCSTFFSLARPTLRLYFFCCVFQIAFYITTGHSYWFTTLFLHIFQFFFVLQFSLFFLLSIFPILPSTANCPLLFHLKILCFLRPFSSDNTGSMYIHTRLFMDREREDDPIRFDLTSPLAAFAFRLSTLPFHVTWNCLCCFWNRNISWWWNIKWSKKFNYIK